MCTPPRRIYVNTVEKKRNKLRAKLAVAPPAERAAIEMKLQRTYSVVPRATKPSARSTVDWLTMLASKLPLR